MSNQVVHFEVIGTDGAALEGFYHELFDWHLQRVPELGYATIDTHSGSGINGGIGTVQQGEPYVTFYIEVADLQAALDKIEAAGGKTIVPPTYIPGIVSFAHFADPAGNKIGLVGSDPNQQGPGVSEGSGAPVSWFEVLGPNPSGLAKFYEEQFGWTPTASDAPGGFEYYQVEPEQGGIGGGIGSSPDGQPHVTLYAEVADLQARLDTAESLGGKALVPPTTLAGVEFAQLLDPQGMAFGLWRNAE
ncbi:MAG: VOC family protein [Actinomycetota bacterium]